MEFKFEIYFGNDFLKVVTGDEYLKEEDYIFNCCTKEYRDIYNFYVYEEGRIVLGLEAVEYVTVTRHDDVYIVKVDV